MSYSTGTIDYSGLQTTTLYVLVIAQPECNMPYIALEQYNARGPQAPRALCHPVQYMVCCTRAPAITNLLPNDVKLV